MGGSRTEIVEGGGMIPLVTGPRKAQLRRRSRRSRAADELSVSGGAAAGLSSTSRPQLAANILSKSRTAARLSLLLICGLIASAFSGVRSVGAHMVRSSVDGRFSRLISNSPRRQKIARNLESFVCAHLSSNLIYSNLISSHLILD